MSELHVVFKVGGMEYAIAAEKVVQMDSFTGASIVPGAPPYVAGIVQVRGKVVPVVDLRVRFGLAPAPITIDSRIVVAQDGARPVALLADSAREVVKLELDQIEPPPAMIGDEAQGFVKAVVRLGARILMVIDFNKVIGEDSLHGQ